MTRKSNICTISNIELKAVELDNKKKEYHITGFASVPFIDNSDNPRSEEAREYPDFIPESLQHKIVEKINKGFASRVGLNHDFFKEGNLLPVAAARAELKAHPGVGKLSTWVDVTLDETSPKFQEVLELAETGKLKGFSIEYQPSKTHLEIMEGKPVRVFDDVPLFGISLVGGKYTPVNPMATVETIEYKAQFVEEEKSPDVKEVLEVFTQKIQNRLDKLEAIQMTNPEVKVEPQVQAPVVEVKPLVSPEDMKTSVREMVAVEMKAMMESKEPLMLNTPKFEAPKSSFDAEYKAWHEAVTSRDEMGRSKVSVDEQYARAAKFYNKLLATSPGFSERRTAPENRGMFNFGVTGPLGRQIEYKGWEFKAQLEHDTSKIATGTTYYQSAAELADIYEPVVVSQLNDDTVLWGALRKVDVSSYGDRYGFRIRYGRNTSAGNYDESATDSPTPQVVQRLKAQIPFMWYRVSVQVSGQMIEYARGRGGIGDLWSDEIKWSTADLLRTLNGDLFDSTSPSSGMVVGGQALSLRYLVDDSTTHTTLYGHDRTTGNYTTLQGNLTAQSGSPRPALDDLRRMYTTVMKNGAKKEDLIFVGDHIQMRWILGLAQVYQQIVDRSSRVGFEGMVAVDGIPFFADDQCDDGFIYLLDIKHTFLLIRLAPTVEELAKTGDFRKAQIKIYYNLVSTAPNHNYLMTGFATS